MSKKERDPSLDAVKGFTILIVMLGHVLVLNGINDPVLYDWIKAVQMPLFMMAAGYLCGISHKAENLGDYGRMLKKRAVGYMLPFFSWTLVFHPDDFTWAFPAYLEQPERGLWFLLTLFVLTLMVYTAQLFGALAGRRSRWLGTVVFWLVYLILTAAVYCQNMAGISWFGPHLTKIYIPYYMAAYVYGEYERPLSRWVTPKVKLGAAVLGGLFCLAAVCTRDMMVMENMLDYGLQTLASFGGCISVIVFFYRLRGGKCKRFLAWLGQYTLEVYSIHYHFARILNRGTLDFTLYSPEGIGFVLASFCVMSLLSAAVILLAKRFRLTNFLLYGKKREKGTVPFQHFKKS